MSNLLPESSLHALVVRLLSDQIPQNSVVDSDSLATSPGAGSLDALYLFGQTSDNEESVLERAVQVVRDGTARKILFSASEPKCGFPGFGPWFFALRQRGISEDLLLGVPPPDSESFHTLTEAEALVHFAKSKGFLRIGICASAFHQVRAFMTTVSVAAREFRNCRLYSIPGTALPWDEVVTHSQGLERGTRAHFILTEFERIERYQQKGDILSSDEVLSYLEARDRHG